MPIILEYLCTVAAVVGFLFNSSLLAISRNNIISSALTTALLRSQQIIDAVACVLAALLMWFCNDLPRDPAFAAFVCYVWVSQAAYWFIILLSVCNLTSLSVDRLLATVYGSVYKVYQRRYILTAYLSVFLYALSLVIPFCFLSKYIDGKCIPVSITLGKVELSQVFPFIWLVFYYIFPSTIMLAVQLRVVIYLKKRSMLYKSRNSNSGSNDESISRVSKRLTIVTVTISSILLLTNFYGTIFFILDALDIVEYTMGSELQKIDISLAMVPCVLNPILLLTTVPVLHSEVKKVFLTVRNAFKLGFPEKKPDDRAVACSGTQDQPLSSIPAIPPQASHDH